MTELRKDRRYKRDWTREEIEDELQKGMSWEQREAVQEIRSMTDIAELMMKELELEEEWTRVRVNPKLTEEQREDKYAELGIKKREIEERLRRLSEE